ncbi:20963_t:CDS:2, partial [Rhizophagus irregularis]
ERTFWPQLLGDFKGTNYLARLLGDFKGVLLIFSIKTIWVKHV